ncbi:MAG TPA: hypothetical protein VH278_07120, partial [Burkholderiaceae bacterium]|nr:hypothetical protein [Burkholderiaceae bacterium]
MTLVESTDYTLVALANETEQPGALWQSVHLTSGSKAMRVVSRWLTFLVLTCALPAVWAEEDRPYAEGPVTQIA